jgi:hypothetical protein
LLTWVEEESVEWSLDVAPFRPLSPALLRENSCWAASISAGLRLLVILGDGSVILEKDPRLDLVTEEFAEAE